MSLKFEFDIDNATLFFEYIRILGGKRTMLFREIGSINTIALGSSHGDYSFNPIYFPGSFNLCCRSQDLKYSFLMHQRISRNFPSVKNIVLYYSIFSPGGNSELSPVEGDIFPALNELFGLGVKYKRERLVDLSEKISGKLNNYSVEIDGFRGFFPREGKVFIPETYEAIKRAEDHMRFNGVAGENIWLVRMILLAKHLRQNIFIVIPPARSDYKAAAQKIAGGGAEALFPDLYDILKNYHLNYNFKILNFLDNHEFSDEHFGDYDHLVPWGPGAEILSKLIYDQVQPRKSPGRGIRFKLPQFFGRSPDLVPLLPSRQ